MAEQFNEKEGLLKALKTALRSDGFILAVFDMLFGDENAAKRVEFELKRASQENTLNEMVSVHRFFKSNLDESKLGKVRDIFKARGLFKKMGGLKGKTVDFYRKVLIETLKKPGQVTALLYMVKAVVTLGYPIDDVIAMPVAIKFFIGLLETAVEVAGEENEQPSLNEQITVNKLRRCPKHASHKKQINEEIEDRYGGRMPVNVYTGRFQPFHLGHLSNLQEAAKRGLRTVICPVMAGKTAKSIAAHPFNGEVEDEMFGRLKSAYSDLIADIIPISRPSLDTWVEAIRERGMEPITWTTGMDRKPSYEAMIQRYGKDFNLVDNFEVIGLDKDMDAEGGSATNTAGISGTAIRQCLVNGDEEGFKEQMPQCLWDMYDVFRQALMPAQQTITESVAYKDFKKCLNKGLNELLK
jgi:hypothetical protein